MDQNEMGSITKGAIANSVADLKRELRKQSKSELVRLCAAAIVEKIGLEMRLAELSSKPSEVSNAKD